MNTISYADVMKAYKTPPTIQYIPWIYLGFVFGISLGILEVV